MRQRFSQSMESTWKKKRDVFIQQHRLKVGLTCVLLSFCLVAKTLSWVSCAQHSVGSTSQSLWSLAQGWKIRFKPWHLTPDFTSVVAKIPTFCGDSLMGFYFFFKYLFHPESTRVGVVCIQGSGKSAPWQMSSLVNAFIWEEDLTGFCLGWHGNENREFCMCVWPTLSPNTSLTSAFYFVPGPAGPVHQICLSTLAAERLWSVNSQWPESWMLFDAFQGGLWNHPCVCVCVLVCMGVCVYDTERTSPLKYYLNQSTNDQTCLSNFKENDKEGIVVKLPSISI